MKQFLLLTTFVISIFFVNSGLAGEHDGKCFEFVYPLSFEKSDGTMVEVKDEAAMKTYKASWKGLKSYPTLKFPIKVKWKNKDAMIVESQEVLDQHWVRCKSMYTKKESQVSKEEKCFEFVYPLSFKTEDGKTTEVKDAAAMKTYKTSWKEMKSYPSLQFPIQVKWQGKDAMSVDSQDVLDRHWARCKAKLNANSGSKKCFNLVYPIAFTVEGVKTEVTSAEDMITRKKEWAAKKIKPVLSYPVEIKWEGKEPIQVNSDEEMKTWRMKCGGLKK